MKKLNLQQLKELHSKTDKEKWTASEVSYYYGKDNPTQEIHWSEYGECIAEIVHGTTNAAFIAAAHNQFPAMVARIEELEGEVEVLTQALLLTDTGDIALREVQAALGGHDD